MTVGELIEKLKKLDQDIVVAEYDHEWGTYYNAKFVEVRVKEEYGWLPIDGIAPSKICLIY